VGFAVVRGKNLLNFELLWHVNGEEREEGEEEQRGEREVSGCSCVKEEEGEGLHANYQNVPPSTTVTPPPSVDPTFVGSREIQQ